MVAAGMGRRFFCGWLRRYLVVSAPQVGFTQNAPLPLVPAVVSVRLSQTHAGGHCDVL